MNTPKFNIGSEVWYASTQTLNTTVPCPDCFGTRWLKVELADGTVHTIDCAGCARGYLGPAGFLESYVVQELVTQHVITGVSYTAEEGIKYTAVGFYEAPESVVFETEEDAKEEAARLTVKRTEVETKRLANRMDNAHTWAWHVHYHRRALKEARKQVELHSAQLEAAKRHTKEEKTNG